MKKHKSAVLAIILLLSLLTGCGDNAEDDAPVTVHVLTYSSDAVRSGAIAEYRKAHKDVVVEFEVLSDYSAEDLELRVRQLRTEIMSGGGPDVYLLPTYVTTIFSDVEMSMRDGVFYDITEFYDADTELGKETLNTAVMDAGVVDGSRYVLPLGYNLPMVCADKAALASSGMDIERMKGSFTGYMEELMECGDSRWATRAYAFWYYDSAFFMFPEVIDYDNGDVLLTASSVAELLSRLQALAAFSGNDVFLSMNPLAAYQDTGVSIFDGEWPLMMSNLPQAVGMSAVANALDADLEVFPLRAADGALVAEVSFWGAVSAGCEHPAAAYEILREFLLERFQWEAHDSGTNSHSLFNPGLLGWPVRISGSLEPCWNAQYAQIAPTEHETVLPARSARRRALYIAGIDESALLPLFEVQIDKVRFCPEVELDFRETLITEIYLMAAGSEPSDIEINALAEELITSLRFRMAEG